jgi:hypothetical protein
MGKVNIAVFMDLHSTETSVGVSTGNVTIRTDPLATDSSD